MTIQLPEDFLSRLEAGMARWEDTTSALASQGWSMPTFLEPVEVYELLQSCRTPDEVDAAFVRVYERDDGVVFDDVAARLLNLEPASQWRLLLEQVFDAYRRGDFLITIPSLLIVCEGILSAGAGTSIKIKKAVAAQVAAVEQRRPHSLTALEWRVARDFVDELYARSDFDGAKPQVLNRHWVLHGRDFGHWTQADCLRLIQAIDMFCVLLSLEPV